MGVGMYDESNFSLGSPFTFFTFFFNKKYLLWLFLPLCFLVLPKKEKPILQGKRQKEKLFRQKTTEAKRRESKNPK